MGDKPNTENNGLFTFWTFLSFELTSRSAKLLSIVPTWRLLSLIIKSLSGYAKFVLDLVDNWEPKMEY